MLAYLSVEIYPYGHPALAVGMDKLLTRVMSFPGHDRG